MWQSDSSNLLHRIGVIADIGGTEADVAYVSWLNIDEKVYTSSTPSSWQSIVAWRNPWANGTTIYKSGINTSVTTGNVVAKYVWKSHATFGNLGNQVRANYSSGSGDSGSPVYYMNNGHLELLGIHWGHTDQYSYFSPISGIMADLDVFPALEATYPKGDFDYDTDVDFDDFVEFAGAYDNGLYYNSNGDFDDDADVDFDDFVEFAAVYTP
jgi:hypothetical protein